MSFMRNACIVVLTLGLGGLPLAGEAQAQCDNTGTIVGGLGGAALGGLLGSKIGGKSTTGQVAGIGGGVLLGGLLGGAAGRYLTCDDQRQMQQTSHHALETQPSGMQTGWRNPDSGAYGTVTPTRTYQQANGQYCREFEQTLMVNGQNERGYGTACRQPDGTWRIVQ